MFTFLLAMSSLLMSRLATMTKAAIEMRKTALMATTGDQEGAFKMRGLLDNSSSELPSMVVLLSSPPEMSSIFSLRSMSPPSPFCQEWNSDFGLDKDRKKDSWQGF